MPTEQTVLTTCGQIGRILLQSGAEASLIESTVEYVGVAAGIAVRCHTTTTAIFISVTESNRTRLVKVRPGDFDLAKVDRINELSRQFTAKRINFEQLVAQVQALAVSEQRYPLWVRTLGAAVVSVAPMLAFIASWRDLAWAFFVGAFGYLACLVTAKKTATPYFAVAVGGLVISLGANALMRLGLADSANNMVISALMPLVPGVALTNALRELVSKHTITGLTRAADAVLVAGAIGGGVVLGMTLVNAIGGSL